MGIKESVVIWVFDSFVFLYFVSIIGFLVIMLVNFSGEFDSIYYNIVFDILGINKIFNLLLSILLKCNYILKIC